MRGVAGARAYQSTRRIIIEDSSPQQQQQQQQQQHHRHNSSGNISLSSSTSSLNSSRQKMMNRQGGTFRDGNSSVGSSAGNSSRRQQFQQQQQMMKSRRGGSASRDGGDGDGDGGVSESSPIRSGGGGGNGDGNSGGSSSSRLNNSNTPPSSPDNNDNNNNRATRRQSSIVTAAKSSYREVKFYREACGEIVNHDTVQLMIVILIAVNAIMMGIGTFDFVTDNPDIDEAFEKVDLCFLIVFTVELVMQFVYRGLYLFKDGWLVFDFGIVVISWSFSSAQIIRAFRIFRALRLITRIETMKNLVGALFSVLPRMAAIMLLLFLIFYIFAVMFTQLFKDLWEEGLTETNYFSRMDGTFFTLFQIMTLDDWASICRNVQETYSWAWLPFIAFVIISGFIVVNLIIAVICDAVAALHEEDRAYLQGRNPVDYDDELFEEDDNVNEHDDDDDDDDDDAFDENSPPRTRSRNARIPSMENNDNAEQQDSPSNLRDSQRPNTSSLSSSMAMSTKDAIKVDEQIRSLELQIEELTRVQERTIHTLKYLTQHLHVAQTQQQQSSSSS